MYKHTCGYSVINKRHNKGKNIKSGCVLLQAQQAEVKSVREQLWEGIKRVLLRERAKKELAAQMAKERGTSELIMTPPKQGRSFVNRGLDPDEVADQLWGEPLHLNTFTDYVILTLFFHLYYCLSVSQLASHNFYNYKSNVGIYPFCVKLVPTLMKNYIFDSLNFNTCS